MDEVTSVKAAERDERGRLLAPIPGSEKHQFTPITARIVQEKRWARARQAAANRITREAAAIDPTVSTWAEAWGLVAAKQYVALIDSEKPRGDDLYRIGQVMGALPTALETRAAEVAGPAAAVLALPAEAATVLIDLLRQVAERQVIDGEVRDAE